MVKDAEAHAAEDKTRRELIDARNQADSLAYSVEKTVNENRDRLPAADVSRIENAVTALREAAKGDDLAAIRRATDDLQKASHAMAEQLYKQSEANAANAAAAQRRTTTSRKAKSSTRNPGRGPESPRANQEADLESARRAETMPIVKVDPFRELDRDAGPHGAALRRRISSRRGHRLPRQLDARGRHLRDRRPRSRASRAELPDMTREDIEVTVENNTLVLKGTKKFAGEVKDENYRRIERSLRHVPAGRSRCRTRWTQRR